MIVETQTEKDDWLYKSMEASKELWDRQERFCPTTTNIQDPNHPLNVYHYTADGFWPVCKVRKCYGWEYTEIDSSYLYDAHLSWVYFIVVDNLIVKIGESGNPLGIRSSDGQPVSKSTCRFGRLRKGDGTDAYIRERLSNPATEGRVSLWAKRCEITKIETTMGGKKIILESTYHKKLEQNLLTYVRSRGHYPLLNKNSR